MQILTGNVKLIAPFAKNKTIIMTQAKPIQTIKQLSILELSVLFQHLRLGKEHLQKYLNYQHLQALADYGDLTDEQDKHMPSDRAETGGSFLLVLNTIFTCAMGTWLGVSGFLGLGFGSRQVFLLIMIIVAVLSSFLGYYNYRVINQQAKNAVLEQKLKNLQLKLIKAMNKKRREQITTIVDYFNNILRHYKEEDTIVHYKFNQQMEIIHWLNHFNHLLRDKATYFTNSTIHDIFSEGLHKHKRQLAKWLDKNLFVIDDKSLATNENNPKLKSAAAKNFLEILTDPTIDIPKIEPRKLGWLKTNFLNLLVGVLPTILGGFGSMFVYFDGLPKLINDLGIASMTNFTHHPIVKPIEVGVALLITIFFAYSFILSNYKSFQRRQELKCSDKLIINEETHSIEVNARLNVLRKIKLQIVRIHELFLNLYAIQSSLNKQPFTSTNLSAGKKHKTQ